MGVLERLGISVRRLCGGEGTPAATKFSAGDRVMIDEGALQGTTGWVVEEAPNGQRVKVEIETSRGAEVVVVDAGHLCKGEEVSADEAQKKFADVLSALAAAGPPTQESNGSLSFSLGPR